MEYTRHINFTEQDDGFRVGDVISFSLTDGEIMEAIAVDFDDDGMIFCAVDCLAKEYPMNTKPTNEGGYEACELRKALNGEIINRFPAEIRDRMIPFENGDLLRLPTEKEIFGENEYGETEPDDITQWEPMKLRRNRIAFQGHNGAWEWYWLQNRLRDAVSAAYFALVSYHGVADSDGASDALGVRPAFKIRKS